MIMGNSNSESRTTKHWLLLVRLEQGLGLRNSLRKKDG